MEVFGVPSLSHEIALHLDYDDIMNYCRSFKEAERLCRDRYFWQEKARLDFGTSQEDFNDTFLTPAQRYLQLLANHGGIGQGAEHYLGKNLFIQTAVVLGRDDLVDYMIQQGYKDTSYICYQYALHNRLDQVRAMSCWVYNSIIYEITWRGNLEMVQYFLEHQSNIPDGRVNLLMIDACYSTNLSLVQYLMELFTDRRDIMSWEHIMIVVLERGSIPLFEYILSQVPPTKTIALNTIYYHVFASGNEEFVKYILIQLSPLIRRPHAELRASYGSGNLTLVKSLMAQWNLPLSYQEIVVREKNWPMVQALIREFPPSSQDYWHLLVKGPLKPLNFDILKQLLSMIPDSIYRQWPDEYFIKMVEDLMNLNPIILTPIIRLLYRLDLSLPMNWNSILMHMLSRQEKQELDMIFSLNIGYLWNWDKIILKAEEIGNPEMVQYLLTVRREMRMI